jgi:hypothetical protein
LAPLVLTAHDDRPLLVSSGPDGAIRTWHLDGTPGPFNVGLAAH